MNIDTNGLNLGDEAQDTLTGFKGTVVGVTKWLHGCVRISLQPSTLKDGKPIDVLTFDAPQVKLLKAAKHPTTGSTGGPRPEPTRRKDASR